MTIPKPPDDLAATGTKLWRTMLIDYDLTASELVILHEAARTSDELDRLAAALVTAELTVKGSMGQPVSSPLLDDVRRHRDTLGKLLGQLREVK